jgi:hypothetical protein
MGRAARTAEASTESPGTRVGASVELLSGSVQAGTQNDAQLGLERVTLAVPRAIPTAALDTTRASHSTRSSSSYHGNCFRQLRNESSAERFDNVWQRIVSLSAFTLGLHCAVDVLQPVLGFVGVLFFCGQAFAQEPLGVPEGEPVSSPDESDSGFEIGAGAQWTQGNGGVCFRVLSDVDACGLGSPGGVGLLLTPRWRIQDAWSVGAFTQVSWGSTPVGLSTLLGLAAEGRWHPLRRHTLSPWLGVDAGGFLLMDTLNASELGPKTAYGTWAPALGVAAGADIALSTSFTFGLELRGIWLHFGPMGNDLQRKPEYSDSIAVIVAAVVSFIGG